MSNKMKKILCIALGVLLLALIVGAILVLTDRNGEDPSVSQKTKEEIFTKTIHDFGNLRVDNLDDQENTNFVVYAEGVQEIIMTQDRNVLVEIDEEGRSYTFTHADDTLKSMKKGDVFFGVFNDGNADSVTAKVKKIDVSGDRVTVYSDEISLSDLFVYVDIYMDIPLNQIGADAASLSNHPQQGTYGVTLLGAADEPNALDIYEKTLEQPININKGSLTVSGGLSATLKVRVEWRYDAESDQLHTGLWTDVELEHAIDIVASSHFEEKIEFMPIPIPIVGPLRLMLQPAVILTADAVVSGNFRYEAHDKYGYTLVFADGDVKAEPHKEISTPTITGGLGNVEASISLALELRPYYRLGFIGEIYASLGGGVELACAAGPAVEIPEHTEEPAIHACDQCIDGDIYILAKISVGLGLNIGEESDNKESDDENAPLELVLFNDKWKVNDFYISKRGEETDYGWTECPHYLYRTTVTVTMEDGTPGAGAEVTSEVAYKSAVTGKDGQAFIYLPVGEHTVEARTDEEDGSVSVTVTDESAQCEIGMNFTTYEKVIRVSVPWSYIDLNTKTYGPDYGYYNDNNDPGDNYNWVQVYDSKGNLLAETWEVYNPGYYQYSDGTFAPGLTLGWYGTYDASGTLIAEERKWENMELDNLWQYDPTTNTFFNSVEIGIVKYVYNDAGQLMEHSTTYADGSGDGKKAEYDAAGNLIWYRWYDTEYLEFVETFIYDENNRVVQDNEDLWNFGKTRTLTEYRNTYDDQGNLVRVDFTIDYVNFENNHKNQSWGYYIYTYDAAGQYEGAYYYHDYGNGNVVGWSAYDPGFGGSGTCVH